jgi:hypothetical protein
MYRLLKRRLHSRPVLSVERAQNEFLDRLTLSWPANPYFDSAELAGPQMIEEGLDPLVTPCTALPGRFHSSQREVQVVVDDQEVFAPDAQAFLAGLDGSAAQIHERLGAQQKKFTILKPNGAALAFETAAQKPGTQCPGPLMDRHEPDIVPRVAVSRPGIPETYDQE